MTYSEQTATGAIVAIILALVETIKFAIRKLGDREQNGRGPKSGELDPHEWEMKIKQIVAAEVSPVCRELSDVRARLDTFVAARGPEMERLNEKLDEIRALAARKR